jgi:type 1 glutamine amidotransferase
MDFTRRAFLAAPAAAAMAAETGSPARILVVTGGHGFDKKFFTLFDGRPEWKWEHREHKPKSTSTVYAEPIARDFDVVVLYDMPQQISSVEERHFLELFDRGKGVVVLHHALCSYRQWPAYHDITGYRMSDRGEGSLPAFTYLHDTHFDLQRVDTPHPVLEGVPSFKVFDETYGRVFLDGGSQPLMVTNTATSMPIVVWSRTYRLSRVVMIQPGHGPQIFAIPHFRRLVANAIGWVAPRATS